MDALTPAQSDTRLLELDSLEASARPPGASDKHVVGIEELGSLSDTRAGLGYGRAAGAEPSDLRPPPPPPPPPPPLVLPPSQLQALASPPRQLALLVPPPPPANPPSMRASILYLGWSASSRCVTVPLLKPCRGGWMLPQGQILSDESPQQAAIRILIQQLLVIDDPITHGLYVSRAVAGDLIRGPYGSDASHLQYVIYDLFVHFDSVVKDRPPTADIDMTLHVPLRQLEQASHTTTVECDLPISIVLAGYIELDRLSAAKAIAVQMQRSHSSPAFWEGDDPGEACTDYSFVPPPQHEATPVCCGVSTSAAPPGTTACIMYVGWSCRLQEMATPLLRLVGSTKWCTPGGVVEQHETAIQGAMRELCEELLGVDDGGAMRDRLVAEANMRQLLAGPFGTPTASHKAFLLSELLGDLDNLVERHQPNTEVAEALAVPVRCLGDGSSRTVDMDKGAPLELRNHIGFMRMKDALKITPPLIVSSWQDDCTACGGVGFVQGEPCYFCSANGILACPESSPFEPDDDTISGVSALIAAITSKEAPGAHIDLREAQRSYAAAVEMTLSPESHDLDKWDPCLRRLLAAIGIDEPSHHCLEKANAVLADQVYPLEDGKARLSRRLAPAVSATTRAAEAVAGMHLHSVRACFNAALEIAVAPDVYSPMEYEAAMRRLLRALNVNRPTTASFKAVDGVLSLAAYPQRFKRLEEYWTSCGASRSNFMSFRNRLREALIAPLPQQPTGLPTSCFEGEHLPIVCIFCQLPVHTDRADSAPCRYTGCSGRVQVTLFCTCVEWLETQKSLVCGEVGAQSDGNQAESVADDPAMEQAINELVADGAVDHDMLVSTLPVSEVTEAESRFVGQVDNPASMVVSGGPVDEPTELRCDECGIGLRLPFCDYVPARCAAWYCSRGGPPCYGGTGSCQCVDDSAPRPPAEVTHYGDTSDSSSMDNNDVPAKKRARHVHFNAAANTEHSCSYSEASSEDYNPPHEAFAAPLVKHCWHPKLTSTLNRAEAASRRLSDQPAQAFQPVRFSDSTWLAPSLGHALLKDQLSTATAKSVPSKRGAKPWSQRDGLHPSERVFRLPLSEDFEWPRIERFAFYEHTGTMREAWGCRDFVSASVADRDTDTPPSAGCYHFIGQVFDFVQACPYPIDVQINHVECAPASWSSWKTWPAKVLNGAMREAGEEFLWINCIGNRSMGEQPHTAHEHTLGPPTQVTNANQHSGPDKTWCIWLRNISAVAATSVVPVEERWSTLANARGNHEEKMLSRSGTQEPMAEALVDSMSTDVGPVPECDRPANVPCSAYTAHRRSFHHNFGLLAASYAPTISEEHLASERERACAILLPMAPSPEGACFMVPLRKGTCFGVALADSPSPKEQAAAASVFLSIGIETHYMVGLKNASRDIVVAVPWDVTPVSFVRTPTELASAALEKMPAVWCTINALAHSHVYEAALHAAQRCQAMGGPVMSHELTVGKWQKATPTIRNQYALQAQDAAVNPDADKAWQHFLAQERLRVAVMQRDLLTVDGGSNLIANVCEDVRCAADFESELPVPRSVLPSFEDRDLLFITIPEPPLALHRDWLHILPPQAAPPGFKPIQYTDAISLWARRLIAAAKNKNMRFDAHCYEHGDAPELGRRSGSFTLGRGAARKQPHSDGIGYYNPFDLLLETDEHGCFDILDFNTVNRTWLYEKIEEYYGHKTNREILSFVFHGVRWKVDAPRQLRISKNLERYNKLAVKVGDTLDVLEQRGYITCRPICKVADGLTEEGPNPFLYLPEYECPLGGVARDDGAARAVGDMSDPHDGHRERNSPHGEPDGPVVISFNDLSGPKGAPKESYTGPLPFPEPEVKPQPRDKYIALALMNHYAWLLEAFSVTMDDDMRHMFFQFKVAKEDRYLCNWKVVKKIMGEMWYVAYNATTMNQGGRNSSKVACTFAEGWQEGWRVGMDDVVAEWLPKQNSRFLEAYKVRAAKLGAKQARPFWGRVYTDNFDFVFACSELAAHGTYLWKKMNAESRIWLQDHVRYGTCSDWIGARCVNNGGFGTITPSKKERALTQTAAAIAGTLTREDYESNNSFLVHVGDICAWPYGTLHGVWGPLKSPGFDTDKVIMTPRSLSAYTSVLDLLSTFPLASFWSAVDNSEAKWRGTGASLVPIRFHATDCCTDPEPTLDNPCPAPHVAGMCDGLFWRFKLTGEWLSRHITLTEATGPALSTLITVPLFPDDINVRAADATAGVAAAIRRARSEDLRAMQRTLEEDPLFRKHANSTWAMHWKGWGNGITDALSRDNLPMAHRIAAAFNITLTEIPVPACASHFMWRTLVRTRYFNDAFQIYVIAITGASMLQYVAATTSVDQVLEAYKAECNMALSTPLYLVFRGLRLEHDMTMEQYGIMARDTVNVLAKLDGGMRSVSPSPPRKQGELHGQPPSRTQLDSPSTLSEARLVEPSTSRSAAFTTVLTPLAASPPRVGPIVSTEDATESTMAMQPVETSDATTSPAKHGSPQPMTAQAARAMATAHVAEALVAVHNEYAICPDDPDQLRLMVRHAGGLQHAKIKHGTQKADEWGFRKVMGFAKHMGPSVRWMRPRVDSPLIDHANERWFCSLALFWITQCDIEPSPARRALGFGKGLPTSALLAIYGWRRVQRDCGRYVCDMAEVAPLLEALCLQYKDEWGPEAFEKIQARVFSNQELLDITTTCEQHAVPTWSACLHDMWHTLHAYLIAVGARRNEVTVAFLGDDNITRGNFAYIDAKCEALPMTPDTIAKQVDGAILMGKSGSSKTDRLNVIWSKQKQYFRLNSTEPNNFAAAWQRYELAHPCPLDSRLSWPAFSPTGDASPLASDTASQQHKVLLKAANVSEERATLHSYRATCANKFSAARQAGAANLTDATIQAHLRWKTIASLMSYNKLSADDFANNVELAAAAEGTSAATLPTIGPAATLAAVEATIAAVRAPADVDVASTSRDDSAPQKTAETAAPASDLPIVGCDHPVQAHLADSWGLIGMQVNLPNTLWGWDDGDSTLCSIVAFLHRHSFPNGAKHLAYAVTYDGDEGNYAVRCDMIARHVDAPTKARLRKLGPPKPA